MNQAANNPYWVLEGCNPELPKRWLKDTPYIEGISWWNGTPVDRALLPEHLVFKLKKLNPHSSDHGPLLPPFFNENPPLFLDRMIKVMIDEGAANIEAFPAQLHDPDNGDVHTCYRAVNLLGLIHAADLKKSQFVVNEGGPRTSVDFDRLAIDPAKARGELIFRLAESVNVILVHDRLKRRLEKEGFDSLWFLPPGEVAT